MIATGDGTRGADAARDVVELIQEIYSPVDEREPEDALDEALAAGRLAVEQLPNTKCCCTAVAFVDDGLWVGHVGRGGVWLISGSSSDRLTPDDTVEGETPQQEPITRGEEDAPRTLHRAFGYPSATEDTEDMECSGFVIEPGDRVLVVSHDLRLGAESQIMTLASSRDPAVVAQRLAENGRVDDDVVVLVCDVIAVPADTALRLWHGVTVAAAVALVAALALWLGVSSESLQTRDAFVESGQDAGPVGRPTPSPLLPAVPRPLEPPVAPTPLRSDAVAHNRDVLARCPGGEEALRVLLGRIRGHRGTDQAALVDELYARQIGLGRSQPDGRLTPALLESIGVPCKAER